MSAVPRGRSWVRLADLSLLAAIWCVAILTTRAAAFSAYPDLLGPAVMVDLTLTAGLAHWWLGVVRGGLPAWTLSIVLLAGVVLGMAIAPGHGTVAAVLAGLVELTVAGVAVARGRTLMATFRARRQEGWELLDAFEAGLADALESETLARAVRTEAELLWLCVAGWRQEPDLPRGGTVVTHHREAGWFGVLGALLVVFVGEGLAVHLILDSLGWRTAAWLLTASHLYGAMWLIGDAQALRLRPTLVTPDGIDLRLGLRWRARIDRATVEKVEVCSADPAADELVLAVIGPAEVRIVLREPVVVHGLFGLTRSTTRLRVQADDAAGFVRALTPTSRSA